ncbi:unnamed protein product [Coccothraustes coccothraustes]
MLWGELPAAGRAETVLQHPGDGAVGPGKRHSPDPEASFNAVLPVFHLCCIFLFGVLVLFWEKQVSVLTRRCRSRPAGPAPSLEMTAALEGDVFRRDCVAGEMKDKLFLHIEEKSQQASDNARSTAELNASGSVGLGPFFPFMKTPITVKAQETLDPTKNLSRLHISAISKSFFELVFMSEAQTNM